MHRQRATKLAAVLSIAALAVAGCGGGTKSGGGTAKKTVKVGLAYDVGGRGDKSFNDAAAAGLDKVRKDLKLQTKELSATQGESNAAKETRLKLLAQGGYNPVLAIGFAYAAALKKVAPTYPDIKFAIVDAGPNDVSGPNVRNLTFAEEQGSFLVGAAAALKSKTKKIGFIGGVQVPLLAKFEAGFKAGAKAVDKSVAVQSKYLTQPPDFSGFGDPAKGKTAADGMYDAGADVVYAAAGGSGAGVFQSAKSKGKRAIGVDSDQYQTASADLKPVIMTSMLKRVDVAVFDFVKQIGKGKFEAGQKVFDLKVDGVGYARSGGQVDDIASKLDDFKKQIIDGKITVPTTP